MCFQPHSWACSFESLIPNQCSFHRALGPAAGPPVPGTGLCSHRGRSSLFLPRIMWSAFTSGTAFEISRGSWDGTHRASDGQGPHLTQGRASTLEPGVSKSFSGFSHLTSYTYSQSVSRWQPYSRQKAVPVSRGKLIILILQIKKQRLREALWFVQVTQLRSWPRNKSPFS